MPRAQENWMAKKKGKQLKLQRTYHRLANRERNISDLQRVKTERPPESNLLWKMKSVSLLLLYTRNDIVMKIDCNDVINDFLEKIIPFSKKTFVVQVHDSDSTKNKDVEKQQTVKQ
ncbi:hypothetical protein TNCV_1961041 [Trichonephila clavipes]|nr:hypothetical protein TNCV_1961041 [Trichonephila clavipes]